MATLKGVWVFNETIINTVNQDVVFQSAGNQYLRFAENSTHTELYYDDNLVDDNSGSLVYNYNIPAWTFEVYRIVDFGDVEQEVSDEFYEWFTANATQINEEQTPIATITYKGETLETLNSGEYVTLHTKGKKMEDDIRVEATGADTCSGNHIIEVAELPTENINENALYSCGDGYYKFTNEFSEVVIFSDGTQLPYTELITALGGTTSVNTIPTKITDGIKASNGENVLHFYYIVDENDVFLYLDDGTDAGWVSLSVYVDGLTYGGTISDIGEADTEGCYYALVASGWQNYPLTKGELAIAENGTYDVSGIERVVVETPANAIVGKWETIEFINIAPGYPLGREWEQQVNFTVHSADGSKSYKGITHGNKNFLYFITEDGEKEEMNVDTGTIFDFGTTPQVVFEDIIGFIETYAVRVSDGGTSIPAEVATEAEMTALLDTADVGSVYKYTGETDTFENGALYVVEESE